METVCAHERSVHLAVPAEVYIALGFCSLYL